MRPPACAEYAPPPLPCQLCLRVHIKSIDSDRSPEIYRPVPVGVQKPQGKNCNMGWRGMPKSMRNRSECKTVKRAGTVI